MKLYHWTFRHLLPSILDEGLSVARSRGRLPAIWLCQKARVGQLMYHAAERHDLPEDNMVLLSVQIGGDTLRKSKWPGIFYTMENIPRQSLAVVIADSPAFAAKVQETAADPEELRDQHGLSAVPEGKGRGMPRKRRNTPGRDRV